MALQLILSIPQIQSASGISNPFQLLRTTTDILDGLSKRKTIEKYLLKYPSAASKVNDEINTQLHLDMKPSAQLKPLQSPKQLQQLPKQLPKHTSYQTIRLAQLDFLNEHPNFSHCNALLTPMATFGCMSAHRRTRITVYGGGITQTPPQKLA